MNIGKSIKICMVEKSLTRADVSSALGINMTHTSTITNHPNKGLIHVEKLAELFSLTPSEFIAKGE
jgi:hypothetical protein